jgi:3-deoxy-D-manno-octulosonic-acid transferase
LAPLVGAGLRASGVFVSPQEREVWHERLGDVTRVGGCDAWVHAASLGEAVAAAPFVRTLLEAQPGARLQLTATTRGGRERLRALDPSATLAPLDTPQAVSRFFRGVRPERLFLIETELWPHWLLHARADGVPVAVISARLSESSTRRYRRLGPELRALVAGLGAVLCQGEEDRRRWLSIGARPEVTSIVGNLKSDGLPEAAPDRAAARSALGLDPDRPLLVFGNVRPGEARLLVRGWRGVPAAVRERWQVVAVPRHPRALEQLQAEALAAGLTNMAGGATSDAWRWDDRLGVLADWYRAAEVAFVGGSLAPYGGHNPLEPAACGAAVIMGPYHASQRDGVRVLADSGALWQVQDPAGLTAALSALLDHDDLRTARGEMAKHVAARERGSAARAVARLRETGLWPVR